MQKPFFLPLKFIYFNAFAHGLKTKEYRLSGSRYGCITVGREVILSCGYMGARLFAICTNVIEKPIEECPPECLSIYPIGSKLLEIHLLVTPSRQTCMNIA